MSNKKAIAYIDGLNLYHSIKALKNEKLKWLNLQELAESFIDSETELVAVKYFTSEIGGRKKRDKWERQKTYLSALDTLPKLFPPYKGEHSMKKFTCRVCASNKFICDECSQPIETYEEKETDVSIACELVSDAYKDEFDIAFLISSDKDFVPAVRKVVNDAKKIVIMSFPPGRATRALKEVASSYFRIDEKRLNKCLFPSTITTKRNKQIECPQEWQ